LKTPQTSPPYLHAAFALLGTAFLAIFSWVFLQEYLAPWRTTQAQFRKLEWQRKDPHALNLAPFVGGINQIWLSDIDRVDRCTTCHLGEDDSAFVGARQPFTTHSGDWLVSHPPDRFGCTVCHGGQGEATTFKDAAHQPIPFWPDTMRPRELIEANCGTCHRERNPRDTLVLGKGRETIAESGCIACHNIPGFFLDEVRAPRLESVGESVRPDWLRSWLTDPKSYLSQSRMPNFRLKPAEIEGLSAFLLSQRETTPLDSSRIDWKRADPASGKTLFRESRCVTCHMLDSRGGTIGPDLSKVGSKVRRDWLFSYLKDPMRDQPETLMLRFHFSDDQIRDLTEYMMEDLTDPDVPQVPPEIRFLDPAEIERGRQAFTKHGCYSCHRFSQMENLAKIGPSLEGIGDRNIEPADFRGQAVVQDRSNWLFLKLRDPGSVTENPLMPTYNFKDDEVADAVVALLSIRKEDLPASRVTDSPRPAPYKPQGEFGALVSRYRCLSCHQVHGSGGTLSTVPLDRIGSQLQQSYLESYLMNPSAVRVSIEARMPHFNMERKEAQVLSEYFSKVFLDDSFDHAFKPAQDAVIRGERLYTTLGCRSCHMVGNTGGYVGPDLSNSGRRLKTGWVEAWVSDPNRWKPETLQPNYGLKPPETEALTAYLMTLKTASSHGGTP
jgi:cytochrome c2/nitrate reductase cytochrome c-type subunit